MLSAGPQKRIRDLPPFYQHVALHSGLDENDPADKRITYDSMVQGLMDLGETPADAEATATKVLRGAWLKLPGAKGNIFNVKTITVTVFDIMGLMHPAAHTAIWDDQGNVRQNVLRELAQEPYATEEKGSEAKSDTKELYIPVSKLEAFRQHRFKVNKETNPSGCLATMFAKKLSNDEFATFERLYIVPTRTMKVNGKDEPCFTFKQIDDFYSRPYVIGNQRKEYVKAQRAATPRLTLGN